MNDTDILRPLAVFLSVVERGSFRRAAEEIGISAPLASQIISSLEEELGEQLLYRSTRRIAVTDAGSRLVREMGPAFESISGALDDFRKGKARPRGRLSVTAPTVLAQPAFGRFVQEYMRENPDLQLEIDLSDEHRDPIRYSHDLALRIGRPDGGDRVRRLLFETEGILCASPTCGIATPEELQAELFIRPPEVPEQLVLARGSENFRIVPKRQLVVNNGGLVREMLRFGGFAAFPAFSVGEALTKGDLVRILPDWSLGAVEVHALYTARRARLSNARHFADALSRFIHDL